MSIDILHHARHGGRIVARIGLAAQGMMYLLIGGIALLAALFPGQRPHGTKGSFSALAGLPAGNVLLALLAAGLVAFVIWQVLESVLDPACREHGKMQRIAVRVGHLFNAGLHAVLMGEAVWQLLGHGAGDHTQARLIAFGLRLPLGAWLVGGVGVGVACFGVANLLLAGRPGASRRLDPRIGRLRGVLSALLVYGYLARAVLFGTIGVLLAGEAWRHAATGPHGIGGALEVIRDHGGGGSLGVVATGLIAFGLSQWMEAVYRRLRPG